MTAERKIEEWLQARFARPGLVTPSGRLALYVVLRRMVTPGQRVLLSPLTDDVVVFVVLAAGARPVFAPVDPDTGNLAIDQVDDPTWDSLAAVITTNLYGVAEDSVALRSRCDQHGVQLIEDIAHGLVIDDPTGRPLGHRGDALVISFSKHGHGRGGGALILADEVAEREAREVLEAALQPASQAERFRGSTLRLARRAGAGPAIETAGKRVRKPTRPGHRMHVQAGRLTRALTEIDPAGSQTQDRCELAAFDRWVGIDRHRYRQRPSVGDLRDMLGSARTAEADVEARRSGTTRLLAGGFAMPPGLDRGGVAPLFRVPILVADRARAATVLERAAHPLHYVYDPPLDDLLGPDFCDRSPDPTVARSWASDALPIDPLRADAVLDALATHDPGAFDHAR